MIPKLGELKDQIVTVAKCAEHVHRKGYRFFAMGQNGMCYSGPGAGETYFRYGPAAKTKCVKGVGKKGAAFVYTFGELMKTSVISTKDEVQDVEIYTGIWLLSVLSGCPQ